MFKTLVLFLLFFSFFSQTAEAQRKSDLGFFAGTSYYLGELNVYTPFYMPSLAFGPILRYNFNPRHSVRGHFIYNNLRGFDENYRTFDPNIADSDREFAASFVDLGLNFEFNWWPYKTAFRKTKYSPYVTAGVAYNLNYDRRSVSHLNIPFGIGFKANLGKRLSGGVEHTVRKTFTDAIEGDDPMYRNIGREDKIPLFGNSDWTMFTGIFLTYKIFEYRDDCPAYDESTNKKRR